MIGVALTCARNNRYGGDPCPEFMDSVEPAEAEAWYRSKLTENAWTEEDGKPYCPRHTPADNGAIIQVSWGEDYQPIGDSGLEIRLPRDGSSIAWTKVEVRQSTKSDERD